MKKIGIIGLGTMGFSIASNLLKKGYKVYGQDIDISRKKLLKEQGGHDVEDCAAMGKLVDTVIVMVFKPGDLKEVLFGEKGLTETFKEGGTVVVTASIGPKVIEEVEPRLTKRGIRILDAPVMADYKDAAKGEMHVLISGAADVIESERRLLEDIGSFLYTIGDRPGMAQAGKMCLQDLFCLTFEAGYETISLARSYGLVIEEIRQLFEDSPASSEMLHMAIDLGLKREFKGTYSPMSILNKDVHIAVEMAKDNGLTLPASQGTADVFQKAFDRWPDEDVWAGIKIIENEP